MQVLITGAGGFIGSHLVEDQLKRQRQVRALDIHTSGLAQLTTNSGLRIIEGDIQDQALLERAVSGVDVVFHLASVHLSIATSKAEYRRVNVDATRHLLEICRHNKVSRFIHCSSVGVYGKITHPPMAEDAACAPESIYDITKLEGERTALQFYQDTGFPVVVVRPAWVYGPRCPRTLKLFRSIVGGKFFFVGNGKNLRHCIYVTDLLEAFERCVHVPQAVGEIYNLADSRPVSLRELVDTIAAVSGKATPRMTVPLSAIYPLCIASEMGYKLLGKEPPISRRSLNFFTNSTSFDISKVQQQLNFLPQVSLHEGFRLTYEYLQRDNGM
jgi:nucleoside-diphosphate-sugar epimerase